MEDGRTKRIVEFLLDAMMKDGRAVDVAAAQIAALGEAAVPLLCSFLTVRAQMLEDYRALEGELRGARGAYTQKYRELEAQFRERYGQDVDYAQMAELTTEKGSWYNPVRGALKALSLIGDRSCLSVLASLPFRESQAAMRELAGQEP